MPPIIIFAVGAFAALLCILFVVGTFLEMRKLGRQADALPGHQPLSPQPAHSEPIIRD